MSRTSPARQTAEPSFAQLALPAKWAWTTVGDITLNFDGRRVPVKAEDRAKRSGPFPYYGASGIIDDIDDYLFDGEYLLVAEDGANLLSRSTPIAFTAKGRFWVNNHAHILQLRECMPLDYLRWFLNGRNLQFYITGTAQPKLNQVNLNRIEVPLAPVKEQRRIADALDELLSDLDAGVTALERARAKLKQYRSAVLKAAVEGSLTAEWRERHPVLEPASELLERILAERRRRWEAAQLEKFKSAGKSPPKDWKTKYPQPVAPNTTMPALPVGWCWATVDQCAGLIQYGTSAKTNSATDGVPVLRMGNIRTDGTLDLTELKYLPTTHEEFPTLLLQSGDLLFNRTNSAELVGKTGHYRGAPSPSSFASYLIRVRMIEGATPEVVGYALNSAFGRRWVSSVVTQMVGQANVNGTKLASFTFPLPPRLEQSALVEAVEDQLSVIEHLETDLDARLKGATALRQSLLRHAFSGQLVPQDPTDEPASELLRRIAAEREERTRQMQAAKRATTKTKSTTSPRNRAAKTRK